MPALRAEALPPEVAALSAKLQQKQALSADEKAVLFNWWKARDPQWMELQKKVIDHAANIPKSTSSVMVCAEGYNPIVMHSQGPPFLPVTHILKRGDTNQKQAEAKQSFLRVLNRTGDTARWKWDPPAGAKYAGKRRSFANWLTDTEQGGGALMARVTANRLWQHHFGKGIVVTTNDLGKSGAMPSHPELLDWLAAELIRGQWKLKPMHRLMMTSTAYRQSSVADAHKVAADLENQYFMRRIPRRVEGEVVRDSILAVGGMLDITMYGAGTLDENSVRRSIYFTVKRSQLVNSMVVFDAPEPLTSQGTRPTTTVAPQALMLMNSPQVRRWAEAFSKRLNQERPLPPDAALTPLIRHAYELALNREPRPSELQAAEIFIRNGLPSGRDKALADFCQTLFSLNEFSYSN